MFDFRHLRISQNEVFQKCFGFLILVEVFLLSAEPESNIIVLEVMVLSTRSEKHENDGFSDFLQVEVNSY